ncbi:hypothetical protein J4Q44_G00333730 [Coregonus suidteri]|uniref:Uncharacterized protein n=1 Tax=Coregonus suidteri TaxID=861788 RepID=A0AAN8L199_9TELE
MISSRLSSEITHTGGPDRFQPQAPTQPDTLVKDMDRVFVYYVGMLLDGTLFHSSLEQGKKLGTGTITKGPGYAEPNEGAAVEGKGPKMDKTVTATAATYHKMAGYPL